jgi:L-ascorbate metabolism protein UlaG (beta-lactamase superfamily)
VKLRFYGHACFGVEIGSTSLCIDPFEPGPHIDLPSLPDHFTHWVATHEHDDHNAGHAIPSAERFHAPGALAGIRIERAEAAHDEFGGRLRGGMTDMLRITGNGATLLHCGDLGERPSGGVLRWLAQVPIDVLIVPVGGYYTLGTDGALELARLLQPRAVVPCHAAEHGATFPHLGSIELLWDRAERQVICGSLECRQVQGLIELRRA